MKKRSLKLFLLAVILIGSGIKANAKLNLNEIDYLNKVELINNRIQYDLMIDSKNRSGDLNYEFLKQMQSHQEIMIEFAQNEIKYSSDENMKSFAQEIAKDRYALLKKIKVLLKEVEKNLEIDTIKEAAYYSCFDEIYQKVMNQIKEENESVDFFKGIDRDFIERMIIHSELTSEMVSLIDTFTSSEMINAFNNEVNEVNTSRLESLYELIKKMDEKKDDSI